jgi:hypothetical protein
MVDLFEKTPLEALTKYPASGAFLLLAEKLLWRFNYAPEFCRLRPGRLKLQSGIVAEASPASA